jgi:synaptobrevin family protein YKT6
MTMFSKTVAERTKPAERAVIEEKDYKFHTYAKSNSLCAIAITEQSYPDLVAQQLLSKMMDEFESKHPYNTYSSPSATSLPLPSLNTYVTQYQNSDEVDSIGKVQRELDETKQVLHKTIESLLERGEKIDNLVQKSDDLSAQSKMFYTQAKKQNSCCIVM